MLTGIWDGLKGWKIKGLSVGYIVLVVLEKVLGLDVPGFAPGDQWLTEIWVAIGIFAGRDTVTTVTGK